MSSSHLPEFVQEIFDLTGQDPARCYQCGKCSAGCPMREFTNIAPNTVVRYVQLGFYDEALRAATIWMCAGCQTCSSRCPQSFDLARFMDAMRELALRKKAPLPDADVTRFHTAFLDQIRQHGRAFEMGLVLDYKLRSGHMMQDVDVAPAMFLKGKIGLRPHRVRNTQAVREIFRRTSNDREAS